MLENDPVDLEGRPFPTRHWLACRALAVAVSRLEATGGVRALEDDEGMTPHVTAAHAAHARLHAGHRVGGVGDARRVKCLHAQLAFALAQGGNPVGDWIIERGAVAYPTGRCCADALGDAG